MIRNVSGESVPAARVVFPPMALASQWCQGTGIELGAAAHNPFELPGAINVAPWSEDPAHFDWQDWDFFRRTQIEQCGEYAAIDLIGEAAALPVANGSQDYVISSHVIEHVPDVIAALEEWDRVLRSGGIAFWIAPHPDALPEDRGRGVTPLSHYIADWLMERTVETDPGHPRGHYHVMTLESMAELVRWCVEWVGLDWEVVASEAIDSKVGNGATLVCRKRGPKLL